MSEVKMCDDCFIITKKLQSVWSGNLKNSKKKNVCNNCFNEIFKDVIKNRPKNANR